MNPGELSKKKELMKEEEIKILKEEVASTFVSAKRKSKRKKLGFGEARATVGWREAKTPEGKSYWYHTSGVTTWNKPNDEDMIN